MVVINSFTYLTAWMKYITSFHIFVVIVHLEVPSADEAELYMVLQECLGLRERYVYKEEVAPWEKEEITDPSTPKPNSNPFAYSAEQRTDVSLVWFDHILLLQ